MQLLKNRDFGDYFSDTFQFFRENFKGLILNFLKLQGIIFILIFIALYFYSKVMNEQFANMMTNAGQVLTPEESMEQAYSMMASYLSLPFLCMMFLGIISSIISANYIPIYMELYRKQQSDISFNDIIEKFKERLKDILLLTVVLIVLFIPIYIIFAIVFFISMITIVGWIFVLGFFISYFTQIWFYSNYAKTGSFQTLGNTFTIFKDNFFKITGATSILLLIFIVGYYIVLFGLMLFISDTSTMESIVSNMNSIYSPEMLGLLILTQVVGLIVGTIITLLVHIQQGMMFYSRINEIDQISEHEDIESIGNDSDSNTFIQSH